MEITRTIGGRKVIIKLTDKEIARAHKEHVEIQVLGIKDSVQKLRAAMMKGGENK